MDGLEALVERLDQIQGLHLGRLLGRSSQNLRHRLVLLVFFHAARTHRLRSLLGSQTTLVLQALRLHNEAIRPLSEELDLLRALRVQTLVFVRHEGQNVVDVRDGLRNHALRSVHQQIRQGLQRLEAVLPVSSGRIIATPPDRVHNLAARRRGEGLVRQLVERFGNANARCVVTRDLHHQVAVVRRLLRLLDLVHVVLHHRGGEASVRHHRQLLEQTFLQVLLPNHAALHRQAALDEALKHLRVGELLQHFVQRPLHVLGEVLQVALAVEHQLALRLALLALGEELPVAAEHRDEERQERVEQTALLQNRASHGDLLRVASSHAAPSLLLQRAHQEVHRIHALQRLSRLVARAAQHGDRASHTRHVHAHLLFQLALTPCPLAYSRHALAHASHGARGDRVLRVEIDDRVALAVGDLALVHVDVHARLHRQLLHRGLQRALDSDEERHRSGHVGEQRGGNDGNEDVVPRERTARHESANPMETESQRRRGCTLRESTARRR